MGSSSKLRPRCVRCRLHLERCMGSLIATVEVSTRIVVVMQKREWLEPCDNATQRGAHQAVRPRRQKTMNEDARSYRIVQLLGGGGYGDVYRAESAGPVTGLPVALRLLHPGLDDMAPTITDQARRLAMVEHRAIVQLDRMTRLDGRLALITEFIPGADLFELRREGAMPLRAAMELVEQTASALHTAYAGASSTGESPAMLHQDVKPRNLRLTAGGETRLLDFWLGESGRNHRVAGAPIAYGGRPYLAPERYDFVECHRGNVYSLGVVLFEALTTEWFGTAAFSPRRHTKQRDGHTETLRWRGIPETAIALFTDMTAFEPEDRPSAEQVVRQARALRDQAEGPGLAVWAAEVVPPVMARDRQEVDPLIGRILREDE